MPFFNCSTSLFAYIIYFGGEKNLEEKIFRCGNCALHIRTIRGCGYAFYYVYTAENQTQ